VAGEGTMAGVAGVHDMATSFNKQVQAYEFARPSYPKTLVADVAQRLGLRRGSRVLDLAAGNGKLTRILAECEFDLAAVEPSLGMREGFQGVLPQIPIIEGTSAAIPFLDATFEAVFVGQAFHWFANDESLFEIRRVLKRGGALVLVWNAEDRGTKWVEDLVALYTKLEPPNVPQYRHGTWRRVFAERSSALPFTPLQEIHLDNPTSVTREQIWQRVLSISYISALEPVAQAALRRDIFDFIEEHVPEFSADKHAAATTIYPYRTDAFWTIAV